MGELERRTDSKGESPKFEKFRNKRYKMKFQIGIKSSVGEINLDRKVENLLLADRNRKSPVFDATVFNVM